MAVINFKDNLTPKNIEMTNVASPSAESAQQATVNKLLMVATLALQGVATDAVAETVPERGLIAFKYLNYLDRQSSNVDTVSGSSSSYGKNRIKVDAASLLVSVPVASEWLFTGTYTSDAISGASPRFYASNLNKMSDHRDAYGLNVKKYFQRATVSFGANLSSENDYLSRGFSLSGSLDSENHNTTLNAGVSVSNDVINPTNTVGEVYKKHVTDWLIGVTQVLTQDDIVQLNLGLSTGNGYFNDPYKSGDLRPSSKDHYTVSARWNHFVEKTDGTSHLGYRYYHDTFGVISHTLTLDYDQPLKNGWLISPFTRFYSQNAANFYVDPADLSTISSLQFHSLDQRLSAYGAVTYGLKVAKQINHDWDADFKIEQYRQNQDWSLSSNTGTSLPTFTYRAMQLGISRKF